MARYLVAGEALVDLVVLAGGKAPVARPGGSPLNVAVGLARLDHDVVLVTRIGDDAYGELLREHAEASGVRLHPASVVRGAQSSTATATLAADGSASYDFQIDASLPEVDLPDVDVVHVGSLGSWLQPGADVVSGLMAAARQRGVLVTYDPNARPRLVEDRAAYLAAVTDTAAAADVVKASDEDIEFLTGDRRSPPWRSLLDVITQGSDGVAVRVGEEWSHYVPPPISVVDTIGAGDSFMSGLLDGLGRHGLFTREQIEASLDLVMSDVVPSAAAAAGITCGRAGADPPTRAELDAARG